ncbi:RidA family protein [Pantoea vagans]|uniref:RidA family protein n=1 Tax=Pantoea vagans TaxID=470934 RepID=UPI002257C32E|nr:RidA family protein [Pantoea vagans]MCX3310980.1 RidA family protein [Pantoea vagans]
MKENINTQQAPSAIGPYSQAIRPGNLVFTSGQLPLIPETIQFPAGGIREQTRQSLRNVKAILESTGAGMDTIIKTTCFLADMFHFSEFNEEYSTFFTTDITPARSCVQAARLPKDALVEVEVMSYVDENRISA